MFDIVEYSFELRLPFAVYVDFESLTKRTEAEGPAANKNSFDYQQHEPCAVGYKLVSLFKDMDLPYKSYTGKHCTEHFVQDMLRLEEQCLRYLFDPRRMRITNDQVDQFERATRCHICKEQFDPEKGDKVRDHDHVTGEYRGPAHNKCNLQLRTIYKIPIFLHNFRGYDAHIITKVLPQFQGHNVKVIGQSMEKYLTLQLGKNLVFKDSLMFLNASLASLADNLRAAGKENFVRLRQAFTEVSEEQFDLLIRKGVFPYDYVDSWERLDEQQLPPKEAFYNKLRDSGISDADYEHAKKVWRAFACHTLRDYMQLYLKGID